MAKIEILIHKADGKTETITFLTETLLDGESVQSLALNEGVRIGGACGGMGLCTTCRVTILEGAAHLSRLTREEKDFRARNLLNENERLACQCFPIRQDAVIRIEA
ncbi:MAG: 2Fe-2S iron-sulfur cluster-binding protein [Chloroherpetonaceae bacterium]